MPHFIPRKIRLRKTSAKSGHEISIPPDWVNLHGLKDKKDNELELLYDSIIVVVPPGMKLNKDKQQRIAEIVEEVNDSKESE